MGAELFKLLSDRCQHQGLEPEDLPLFLRDLAAILKSRPEADVVGLNARLNLLGWHRVKLDYQSVQLALAWGETEVRKSSP